MVRPIARVEELALAIALAVAPELETAPVVALELVQVAVALRTKSVTAAHRHDLVPLLTAEDSAGVAVETSRARAAIEEVTAWEVAE